MGSHFDCVAEPHFKNMFAEIGLKVIPSMSRSLPTEQLVPVNPGKHSQTKP